MRYIHQGNILGNSKGRKIIDIHNNMDKPQKHDK